MDPTQTEPTATAPRPDVALLTLILDYDDLLRPDTRTVRLERELRIGRAERGEATRLVSPMELRIADRWLSVRHARVSRRGDRWTLVDEGSKNGTYVRGERIDTHELEDGDLIELGHRLACFRIVPATHAEALLGPDAVLDVGAVRTASPELAAILGKLARVAPSTQPVLILGETGAGKEAIARLVHRLSGRERSCDVDCGAVPDSLFESALFGHVKGAFTGAATAHTGAIARAHEGTLFLDEIGNLSPAAQGKLLRVIEDGMLLPLGGDEPRRVNVRYVAATNRDLFADPAFRPDLLQRLASHVVRLPPLRERTEDLGVLAAALLAGAELCTASITVPAARRLFLDAFAGNIRQLRSTLCSAALLAAGRPIELEHLPEQVATPASASPGSPDDGDITAARVESALASTRGNVARAARLLGTSGRQIYRYIERWSLSLDKYRP